MKRIWNRLCALLLACTVLAALAPAALADDGADAYRIAVSAAPAAVTAGGSATISATVYCRSDAESGWSEYLGGGAVLTWEAYREGLAAFRGESAGKPVVTTLPAGSSSSSLELLTRAGGVTGSAVQLPLSISVTVGSKTYTASGASVTISPAAQSADVEYAAGFGGSVLFSEADFSRVFSGRGKPGEALDFVTFAWSGASAEMGGSGAQIGTGELTVRVAAKQFSAVFSDVNAGSCAWAAAAVDFMNGYGLIQGADASTFNWRGSMTRGDLILILYRSAGSPAVSGTELPFTDVSDTDYAYDAIRWAWQNKIADGVSEMEFCMTRPVTREQLASILYRLSGRPAVSASLRSYTDADSVSAYAVDAMRWAVGCGYLKGSGAKLNPQSGASRAETVVLLHRYLTKQ